MFTPRNHRGAWKRKDPVPVTSVWRERRTGEGNVVFQVPIATLKSRSLIFYICLTEIFMSIETKEEALERVLALEKPRCPHCDQVMDIWEVPQITVGDGLGWGEPFLFICFNNECPLFKSGWDEILEQTGHKSSYRCMNYPGTTQFELLPVFSSFGGSGQVITDETVAQEKAREEMIKTGFSILADCYVSRDLVQIIKMVMDTTEPLRVRLKAAEMIGDIAETEAIDLLKNTRFGSSKLQDAVDEAVKKIHKRCFTRSCPHCAEIIKQQAKICKHCKLEVAGQ